MRPENLQYICRIWNTIYFSLMNYARSTPKLWKMPIINAAGPELSAICHSYCGQKLQIAGQKQAGAMREAKKRGDRLHIGTDIPDTIGWFLIMLLQLFFSFFSIFILDPRKMKQERSATSQAMAIWCERNDRPPLIFPSILHLPRASEVTRYLTTV